MAGVSGLLGLTDGPPAKRTRKAKGGKEGNELDELIQSVARLSLATAAGLRQVKSAVIRTFLLPANCEYVCAGKLAGAQYASAAAARKGSDSLPPPFALVFASLLQVLVKDVKCPSEARSKVVELLEQATSPQALNGVVRVCRLSKCYSPEKFRVELAFTPEWTWLSDVFAHVWLSCGGTECFGYAPRGPLERSIGQLLGQGKK